MQMHILTENRWKQIQTSVAQNLCELYFFTVHSGSIKHKVFVRK